MSEEQEPLSLSDDVPDDTIKIKRVKLPLNGFNELSKHDTYNANGYHANGNIHAPSAPEQHPYFDELAEEETAHMPIPICQPDGSSRNGLGVNNEVLDEDKADVGAQFIAPSSPTPTTPTTPPTPSFPTQTLPTQQLSQPRNLPLPLRPIRRLWQFSRLLCIALVLIPTLASCFYAYIQLNQPRHSLYTVDAHTGTILWQGPAAGSASTALVDSQGSVQIATLANYEQQLIVLDAHGTMQWQSFVSDGTFALPPVHSTPGTIVATLSEQKATGHSLTLYSFNRATGHTNWHYTIELPVLAQSADILGADNNFIYAVSTQLLNGAQTQVQLLAINQYTGYIGWRMNSPAEANGTSLDKGTLLLAGHTLVWQVEATILMIDATQGTMLWTNSLPYNNVTTFQQEEAQMVVLHGQLIVERNDTLHSFELTTGQQLWNVSVFNFSTATKPASIAAAGQTLLVYGNGQLEALAINDRHVMWQQREMGNILSFRVSDDGTLVYTILLDSVENNTPAQALVAFNAQNGAARWTFQPYSQIKFLDPQPHGFQYHRGIILTTLCFSTTSTTPTTPATSTLNACDHPHLYALNAATGGTLWKFDGNSISNPLLSSDGRIVTYDGNTNAWQQFIDGLRG